MIFKECDFLCYNCYIQFEFTIGPYDKYHHLSLERQLPPDHCGGMIFSVGRWSAAYLSQATTQTTTEAATKMISSKCIKKLFAGPLRRTVTAFQEIQIEDRIRSLQNFRIIHLDRPLCQQFAIAK